MHISKRVQTIEKSFTIALRIEAEKRKAAGEPIIDLGLGDINFGQPPAYTEALVANAKKGVNYYTEPAGVRRLREAIAFANNTLFRGAYDGKIIQPRYEPDEIVHGVSAKFMIVAAAMSVADPGDEVIILSPFWPPYIDALKLAGVVPKLCVTTKEQKFFPSKDQLQALVTPKTKAIILNSPNNPTGRVFKTTELEIPASVAEEHDLLLISDEVYDTIVFHDNTHMSIASLSDSIADRTIVVKGLSKGFGMGGMRFGYTMSKNQDLVEGLQKAVSNTITSAPSLLQEAGSALFLDSIDHVLNIRKRFQERVEFTEQCFAKHRIDFVKVEGSPYIFPDVSPYFTKDMPDSKTFMQKLVEETGVVVLHGGICGNDRHVRIALIQDIPVLEEAWSRFVTFLERHS